MKEYTGVYLTGVEKGQKVERFIWYGKYRFVSRNSRGQLNEIISDARLRKYFERGDFSCMYLSTPKYNVILCLENQP